MSGFWRFVGGLLVGAAAVHLVNEEYKKRNQGSPPPAKENKQPEVKNVEVDSPPVNPETMMIENLILEYESKKNRTKQQNDTLDLLRIKLKQLKRS